MRENKSEIARRKCLKLLGAGAGGLVGTAGILGNVSATNPENSGDPAGMARANVSEFPGVSSAVVKLYSDESKSYEIKGYPRSKTKAYELKLEGAYGSNGEYTPSTATAVVIPVDPPETEGDEGSSETGSGSSSSKTMTKENLTQSTNRDESDGGMDYSTDYESGAWAEVRNTNWLYNDYANLKQSVKWTASGGEVIDNFWYVCADKNGGRWSHLADGNAENDFSGNTAYTKAYADYSFDGPSYAYDVFERVWHTQEVDGDAEWGGRVYTRYAGQQESNNMTIQFGFFYDYDQTCL